MPTIQVKDVPDDVHATLRRRAADAGMSLQEYLRGHLCREARTLTLEEVFDRVDEQTGGEVSLEEMTRLVRAERDAH